MMIVWGGYGDGCQDLDSGGSYHPTTDTWTATSTNGAPTARGGHTAVWAAVFAGSRMIVWGGNECSTSQQVNTGGIYDPVTDTWTTMSTVGAPEARSGHTAVWTGSKMIIWGGFVQSGIFLNSGGIYDPVTDTWAPTSMLDVPAGRTNHTAVWTGSQMIVWGGQSEFVDVDSGSIYDPATDSWAATSAVGAPAARESHTAVWTGSKMIVWGGGGGGYSLHTGASYNPATDTWTSTTTTAAPDPRVNHTSVWTGAAMIAWGGWDFRNILVFNTGGSYNPTTNTWTPTSTMSAPSPRIDPTAVWTGSAMVVWGGADFSNVFTPLNTGGVYFKPPVILVHGYCGSPEGTWGSFSDPANLVSQLQAAGFSVRVANLSNNDDGEDDCTDPLCIPQSCGNSCPDWNTKPIPELAGELAAQIESVLQTKPGVAQVDVVAHSMGGLVTRAFVAGLATDGTNPKPYNGEVRKLTMLGTPNHGAALAGLGIPLCSEPQRNDLSPGSKLLLDLYRAWTAMPGGSKPEALVVAGTYGTPTFWPWPRRPNKSDEDDDDAVVNTASAALPEGSLVRYVPYKHADLSDISPHPWPSLTKPATSGPFLSWDIPQIVEAFLNGSAVPQAHSQKGGTYKPPKKVLTTGMATFQLVDSVSGDPLRNRGDLICVGRTIVPLNPEEGTCTSFSAPAKPLTITVHYACDLLCAGGKSPLLRKSGPLGSSTEVITAGQALMCISGSSCPPVVVEE